MNIKVRDFVKLLVSFLAVFAFRFSPWRLPNMEPILSVQMPFAKRYGWVSGFVFGALSIALFDAFTSGLGLWTLVTAFAYGILGIAAAIFFRNRDSKLANYMKFTVVGIVFYDAVTGLTIGPLLWGQSFAEAFVGQIPFTLNHLASGIIFSLVSHPIYRWVLENKSLETREFFARFGLAKA